MQHSPGHDVYSNMMSYWVSCWERAAENLLESCGSSRSYDADEKGKGSLHGILAVAKHILFKDSV